VARWGWDNNIFCLQLWNELNLFPDWPSIAPQIGEWHNRMALYLREIDPNRHLVSTSFYNIDGIPEVWQAREMDFVEPHVYGVVDMAHTLPEATQFVKEKYGWPVLIDEFGPPLVSEMLNLTAIDPTESTYTMPSGPPRLPEGLAPLSPGGGIRTSIPGLYSVFTRW